MFNPYHTNKTTMNGLELRIGNLVTIDNPKAWPELKDIPLRVTRVKLENDEYFPKSKTSIGLDGEIVEHIQFDEFICGIPLSPSLLERAGFKRESAVSDCYTIMVWERGKLYIIFHGDSISFEIGNTVEHIVAMKGEIEHFHQLQNLFWVLCGKELELQNI
jgi:hypothetical protein